MNPLVSRVVWFGSCGGILLASDTKMNSLFGQRNLVLNGFSAMYFILTSLSGSRSFTPRTPRAAPRPYDRRYSTYVASVEDLSRTLLLSELTTSEWWREWRHDVLHTDRHPSEPRSFLSPHWENTRNLAGKWWLERASLCVHTSSLHFSPRLSRKWNYTFYAPLEWGNGGVRVPRDNLPRPNAGTHVPLLEVR